MRIAAALFLAWFVLPSDAYAQPTVFPGDSGGGISTICAAADVSCTSAVSGDVLVYSTADAIWHAMTIHGDCTLAVDGTMTCTAGGGHAIYEEAALLTQRDKLKFAGTLMTCADDGVDTTVCTITAPNAGTDITADLEEEGVTCTDCITGSKVSVDATLETEIEAVVDLQSLQGAVIDDQVPDSITVTSASSVEGTDTGTLTDGKACTYDLAGTQINCNTSFAASSSPGGNATNADALSGVVKGTMTDAQWCKYTSLGTQIDCNVAPVTDTDTNTKTLCTDGSVLFGEDSTRCELIPTCTGTKKLTFNGTDFSCEDDQNTGGNAFSTWVTPDVDDSDPAADSASDTMTFVEGTGIDLTGSDVAGADQLTIGIEPNGIAGASVSVDATLETEIEAVVDLDALQGQIADAQIADGAVDGGTGGEIADASITAADLAVGAVDLSTTDVVGDLAMGRLNADYGDITCNGTTCTLDASAVTLTADDSGVATGPDFTISGGDGIVTSRSGNIITIDSNAGAIDLPDTFWVTPNGGAASACTLTDPCNSIQRAINKATESRDPRDTTIYVKSGQYGESGIAPYNTDRDSPDYLKKAIGVTIIGDGQTETGAYCSYPSPPCTGNAIFDMTGAYQFNVFNLGANSLGLSFASEGGMTVSTIGGVQAVGTDANRIRIRGGGNVTTVFEEIESYYVSGYGGPQVEIQLGAVSTAGTADFCTGGAIPYGSCATNSDCGGVCDEDSTNVGDFCEVDADCPSGTCDEAGEGLMAYSNCGGSSLDMDYRGGFLAGAYGLYSPVPYTCEDGIANTTADAATVAVSSTATCSAGTCSGIGSALACDTDNDCRRYIVGTSTAFSSTVEMGEQVVVATGSPQTRTVRARHTTCSTATTQICGTNADCPGVETCTNSDTVLEVSRAFTSGGTGLEMTVSNDGWACSTNSDCSSGVATGVCTEGTGSNFNEYFQDVLVTMFGDDGICANTTTNKITYPPTDCRKSLNKCTGGAQGWCSTNGDCTGGSSGTCTTDECGSESCQSSGVYFEGASGDSDGAKKLILLKNGFGASPTPTYGLQYPTRTIVAANEAEVMSSGNALVFDPALGWEGAIEEIGNAEVYGYDLLRSAALETNTLRMIPQASDPGTTVEGLCWWDNTANAQQCYNGSATVEVLTVTPGAALTVAQGGTGRLTSTTAYGLLAAGTTATGAHQTLAAGATTEMLVGGGASALPVWTTATGSGAPVRATTPELVTPNIGAATGTSLDVTGNMELGSGDDTGNFDLTFNDGASRIVRWNNTTESFDVDAQNSGTDDTVLRFLENGTIAGWFKAYLTFGVNTVDFLLGDAADGRFRIVNNGNTVSLMECNDNGDYCNFCDNATCASSTGALREGNRKVSGYSSQCATIEKLTSTDDDLPLWAAPNRAVTIVSAGCSCNGTCSTPAAYSLEAYQGGAWTAMAGAGAAATCAGATTAITYGAVTSNTTSQMAAGEKLRIDVTNTPSPTTDTYTVCWEYTVD